MYRLPVPTCVFVCSLRLVSRLLVLDITVVFVKPSCCCYSSYNNFALLWYKCAMCFAGLSWTHADSSLHLETDVLSMISLPGK